MGSGGGGDPTAYGVAADILELEAELRRVLEASPASAWCKAQLLESLAETWQRKDS